MDSMNVSALDAVTGEVLPERTVLGIVTTPFNNAGDSGGAGGSSSSSAAAAGGGGGANYVGGDHGAVSTSACQSHVAEGTPGLLGSLGLGSNNPSESMTCVPASTATY